MVHQGTPRRRRTAALVLTGSTVLAMALGACSPGDPANASGAPAAMPTSSPKGSAMAMPSQSPISTGFTLTSPAFADGGQIPTEFSCRGQDVSPALAWRGVPDGTDALVLLVDDPDARGWVHWIVLDLPGTDSALPRGVSPSSDPPRQGRNDFGKVGYGGPCPPSGTHRYAFTLYALAKPLGLPGNPGGGAVRAALGAATVLAEARLVGTFKA
jgi:Raf kinase inhibitor-like YbhB/YbcL family protein